MVDCGQLEKEEAVARRKFLVRSGNEIFALRYDEKHLELVFMTHRHWVDGLVARRLLEVLGVSNRVPDYSYSSSWRVKRIWKNVAWDDANLVGWERELVRSFRRFGR